MVVNVSTSPDAAPTCSVFSVVQEQVMYCPEQRGFVAGVTHLIPLRILRNLFGLTKPPISFAVTLSAALGFALSPSSSTAASFWMLSVGTYLLAGAASVLNQIQEADLDALMPRTKHRPIPSKAIALREASLFALCLLISGVLALSRCGVLPLVLGAAALLWYNLVYTYLKRITAFAAVPGALTGALPPLMGWSAAGGNVLSPPALSLAFFFFLWQIPHFWILVLCCQGEYAAAGLPSLDQVFKQAQLKRINVVWLIAAVISGLGLPLSGVALSSCFSPCYFLLSMCLLGYSVYQIERQQNFRLVFLVLNVFLFALMLLLAAAHFAASLSLNTDSSQAYKVHPPGSPNTQLV